MTSLGVDKCVDRYQAPEEISQEIKDTTKGRLVYAVDCVGSGTAARCEVALEEADGDWIGEGHLLALAGNPKKKEEQGAVREGKKREVKVHKISFSTTVSGEMRSRFTSLSSKRL